jgi:hypothetical protein
MDSGGVLRNDIPRRRVTPLAPAQGGAGQAWDRPAQNGHLPVSLWRPRSRGHVPAWSYRARRTCENDQPVDRDGLEGKVLAQLDGEERLRHESAPDLFLDLDCRPGPREFCMGQGHLFRDPLSARR